jgi:hypothetical protein
LTAKLDLEALVLILARGSSSLDSSDSASRAFETGGALANDDLPGPVLDPKGLDLVFPVWPSFSSVEEYVPSESELELPLAGVTSFNPLVEARAKLDGRVGVLASRVVTMGEMVVSLAGDLSLSSLSWTEVELFSTFKVVSLGNEGLDAIGLGPCITRLPNRSDRGDRTVEEYGEFGSISAPACSVPSVD